MALPFFWSHYANENAWRRVDYDWLEAAAGLALRAGDFTNNISLVLAFELPKTRKVLLFVGDAQVGNWVSWHSIDEWFTPELGSPALTEAQKKDTATTLLGRVAFYKVGHHGSHNATAKAKGLELMQSGDLVAFIPVNHEMAVKKGWGKMPLPRLVEELEKLTQGRLVQADQDYQPKTEKGEAFAKVLRSAGGQDGKLFYEWTMPMG